MSTSTGTICVMRHGEREDYSQKGKGSNWTASAPHPFDPPLTPNGLKQGEAAGVKILSLLESFRKPAPTAAYTSPLKRCGETLSSALVGMGSSTATSVPLNIETGLVESINEDWYRSWGAPGADSTWGGPAHCRKGMPVKDEDMDPRVLQPAGGLYNTVEMMNSYDTVRVPIVGDHSPLFDAAPFSWKNLETKRNQHERLRMVVEGLATKHPGETLVLCSHGGPCTHIFEELTGQRWEKAGPCGYTAISVYSYEMEEGGAFKWENLAVNVDDHVGGTLGGIIE